MIDNKIDAVISAMRKGGRYDSSATTPLETEVIYAQCELDRALTELNRAKWRRESAVRGLVNWSKEDQFTRDIDGNIDGGYRGHPDYAEVWKSVK